MDLSWTIPDAIGVAHWPPLLVLDATIVEVEHLRVTCWNGTLVKVDLGHLRGAVSQGVGVIGPQSLSWRHEPHGGNTFDIDPPLQIVSTVKIFLKTLPIIHSKARTSNKKGKEQQASVAKE